MPQPLSQVPTKGGVIIIGTVGHRTLAKRPELAVMAMECISEWSHVEAFFMTMYVELAGGGEADAAAVYLSLESRSAKSAAVTTLAERKLDDTRLKLFRALLKVAKSAQKDRDKLAHWIWGINSELPDAILLSNPKNRGLNDENIYVYTAKDFESIRTKFEKIAGLCRIFELNLQEHPMFPDDELYERLCSAPEIAEILNLQGAPTQSPLEE